MARWSSQAGILICTMFTALLLAVCVHLSSCACLVAPNASGVVVIDDNVSIIGSSSFEGCETLVTVALPDTVVAIGPFAFKDCINLVTVAVPDSVVSIGVGAFRGCVRLVSVGLGMSMAVLDESFRGCTSLVSVSIPNTVMSIGANSFWNCSSLMSVVIPDEVASVGGRAFYRCSSLVSVVISNSVTIIQDGTFALTNLTTVTIPDSVSFISSIAFAWSQNLNSLIWSNSVTYIGNQAFDNTSLVSVTIPDTVTYLSHYTFRRCTRLVSVNIPNSITYFGTFMFDGCTNLASVVIPNSVSSIPQNTFRDCACSESLYVPGASLCNCAPGTCAPTSASPTTTAPTRVPTTSAPTSSSPSSVPTMTPTTAVPTSVPSWTPTSVPTTNPSSTVAPTPFRQSALYLDNLEATIRELNNTIEAVPTSCGRGSMMLSNRSCVPDCNDLQRRSISCDPFCPLPAIDFHDNNDGTQSSSILLVIIIVVISVISGLVGAGITMFVVKRRSSRVKQRILKVDSGANRDALMVHRQDRARPSTVLIGAVNPAFQPDTEYEEPVPALPPRDDRQYATLDRAMDYSNHTAMHAVLSDVESSLSTVHNPVYHSHANVVLPPPGHYASMNQGATYATPHVAGARSPGAAEPSGQNVYSRVDRTHVQSAARDTSSFSTTLDDYLYVDDNNQSADA